KSRIGCLDDKLFYRSPANDRSYSYAELIREVAAVECVPPVYAYQNGYDLFVMLLAGAAQGATLILVDSLESKPAAEEELRKLEEERKAIVGASENTPRHAQIIAAEDSQA